MQNGWRARQFGDVVDRFRVECRRASHGLWDDVLAAYGFLRARGPNCGNAIAKKLVNAKGIWELIGRDGNLQARLLFYFDTSDPALIVFVYGFIKSGGAKDYRKAIETSQSRRSLLQRGERTLNVIASFDSLTRH